MRAALALVPTQYYNRCHQNMPLRRVIFTITAFLSAIAPASSQWLNHPTAHVPRLRDGNPNLSAPAPRTKDGKPDLSGILQLEAHCPPEGCGDYPAAPEFGDLGARLKGGLPYQPWAAELVENRAAQLGRDDPVGRCRPAGAIRLLTFPPPRKILQLPEEIIILSGARRHLPADIH